MLQLFLEILTWTFVSLSIFNLSKALKEGITYLKKLHQIPCDRCVFFTGDYHLKCSVNPLTAMSEVAIACRDFEAKGETSTRERSRQYCDGCNADKLENRFTQKSSHYC
jgi:hypothetical protein